MEVTFEEKTNIAQGKTQDNFRYGMCDEENKIW